MPHSGHSRQAINGHRCLLDAICLHFLEEDAHDAASPQVFEYDDETYGR